MIVSFVLNTEYMSIKERDKWFLKNVSFAKHNDVLIVTHEYIKNHLDEIVDNCADRFYSEFEMERTSADEIRKMNIVYVPDVLSDNLSRTQEIIDLTNNRNSEFERVVIDAVDSELIKRNQASPDFIMNCLHVFESVKFIGEHYNCPIVPYVFSAVRKVHGYNQTLYMTHIDSLLFGSEKAIELHNSFNPQLFNFEILDKREILALVGKKHNFCLFPVLETAGVNEFGIIGEGFSITPQSYQDDLVTDDDLYYECEKYYSSDRIVTRLHPMRLTQAGIGRTHMKNDPASFLLSCKRATTVQSQMIIKAAMWNRAVCSISSMLPYAFLFSKDFKNGFPISDKALNFILFCYFVPDSLMFDKEYWKWRFSNPSANEIYVKHLEEIFKNLNLDKNILFMDNRLELILSTRGCKEKEIQRFTSTKELPEEANYSYLSSKASIFENNCKIKDLFCLNDFSDNRIISTFEVENENADRIDFYLTNDIDGFVSIKSIIFDDKEIECDTSEKYWAKGSTHLCLDLENNSHIIRVIWSVKSYDEAF